MRLQPHSFACFHPHVLIFASLLYVVFTYYINQIMLTLTNYRKNNNNDVSLSLLESAT